MAERRKTVEGKQLWLLPGSGVGRRGLVADVAVDVRSDHLFTYAVPATMREAVFAGSLVRVPYGRGDRLVEGICVRVGEREWDHTHKPIAEVVASRTRLTPTLLELGMWISEYYQCSPGQTFSALLPGSLRRRRVRRVRFVRAVGGRGESRLTGRQEEILDVLGDGALAQSSLLARTGASVGMLRTLEKRGLIERFAEEVEASREVVDRPARPTCPEDNYGLTAGQQAALDALVSRSEDGFRAFLLFGVPGSGKTEVYVRAMREVISRGRQAILLVPEIALATQVVERLLRRFGRVAVLHSGLTAKARREALDGIHAGEFDVVIGTRTAVFAPCPRLGLIVVDEEQEGSFKSLSAPFYHARDVAVKRGQLEDIPVVLGSGTPSLETWYNAQSLSHFERLALPERIPGAELPRVRVVRTGQGEQSRALGRELAEALRTAIGGGQQAILLHNRRGYALHLRCSRCGLTVSCHRCGQALVYHRNTEDARCHQCGWKRPAPQRCLDDTCRGELEQMGLGIQKLESELRGLVPDARLLRLDSDTMKHRDDYAEALQRFTAGEADIMLGTQMVAKGLDFPQVKLVGVIDVDTALQMPTFRSAERVFELVMQVVGRAGRQAGASLALVQTDLGGVPAIRYAVELDYGGFAASELEARRSTFYPPFSRLARMVFADARAGRAKREAEKLAAGLREVAGRVSAALRIDEAEPCLQRRLRDMVRYQVLVRGPRDASLQKLLQTARREKLLRPRVQRLTIDVDPVDLF